MKTWIIAILLSLAPCMARAETTVDVQVNGIASTEGQIVVTIFDNDDDWLRRPAAVETVSAADATDGVLLIPVLLQPGEYAISVYHDLDSNGRMKTNFIGIPREPTGTSNDAKGRFGPPKYRDAKFEVGTETILVPINMVTI